MIHQYRVTMVERRNGKDHKMTQEAFALSRVQVVEFYGLNQPDIVSYKIEEI